MYSYSCNWFLALAPSPVLGGTSKCGTNGTIHYFLQSKIMLFSHCMHVCTPLHAIITMIITAIFIMVYAYLIMHDSYTLLGLR